MNTATDSIPRDDRATASMILDALDHLDVADKFVEAISIISASNGSHGKVLDALATAVEDRIEAARVILWERRT